MLMINLSILTNWSFILDKTSNRRNYQMGSLISHIISQPCKSSAPLPLPSLACDNVLPHVGWSTGCGSWCVNKNDNNLIIYEKITVNKLGTQWSSPIHFSQMFLLLFWIPYKCFFFFFFFFFHLSLLQLKPTLSMKAARCITMTGAKWDSMQYHYLCTTKITHELVCYPTQHKYGANDWRDLTINYKWAGLNSRLQELLASYHYHSLASRPAIKS